MSNSVIVDDRLVMAVRISYPVIKLDTYECLRAEMAVEEAARRTDKLFVKARFKFLPTVEEVRKLHASAVEANNAEKNRAERIKEPKGLVIFDQYFFDRMRVMPDAMPALKSSLELLENDGINYVIAGRDALSEEFVYHVELRPMTQSETIDLVKICEGFVKAEGGVFTDVQREEIANNCRGLSHTQIKNVATSCAYLKTRGQDFMGEIRREKALLLRDVGLEVIEPMQLADVGGLDNVKHFLELRRIGWRSGLPAKGMLCTGIPGAGKTLVAKATAGVMGTTLVKLDMGRFYDKHLGTTERMFDRALRTIDQIAPVTVLVDEIEKYLGSANQDGEHEVSRRLLGRFLFWMQERRGDIIVVGTTNKIHLLPTELTRAGRWDRIFFFDLPNKVERAKIFEIHLRKAGADAGKFFVEQLVKLSDGFTGGEIEQAITEARFIAAYASEALANQHVVKALESVNTLSKTRAEELRLMREQQGSSFHPASVPDAMDEPAPRGRAIAV